MPRIEVRDLAAPDALQPSALQSDTFTGGVQAPIDQNLSQLHDALGLFNKNLRARLDYDEHAHKKALTEAHLAEYQRIKSSLTNEQQLDMIKSGKLPYEDDYFIGAVVKKDKADLLSKHLATQIDNEIRTAPGFGTKDFNDGQYVVDKAKPYVDALAGDPKTMIHFGENLTHIRSAVLQEQQKAQAETNQIAIHDAAFNQIDQFVTKAVADHLTGQQATDQLRQLYQDLGPRPDGTLGLKPRETDRILLGVLQEKAKDPKQASLAQEMLDAPRVSLDGKNVIPALSKAWLNADAVRSIRSTANKTLLDDETQQATSRVTSAALQAFKDGNGTFSTLTDISVPSQRVAGQTVTVPSADVSKEVPKLFLQEVRAANGGQPNYPAEIETFARNNVKHPELIPELNAAFGGFATQASKGAIDENQTQAIIRAGNIWKSVSTKNLAYLETPGYMDQKAQTFYRSFDALRNYYGNDTVAAAAIAKRYSGAAVYDPHEANKIKQDVDQSVKSYDFSYWPLRGSVENQGDLRAYVTNMANEVVMASGLDPKVVLNEIKQHAYNSAAYVNGRVILSPMVNKDHEPFLEAMVKKRYQDNKVDLAGQNVTSSSGMTLSPYNDGSLLLVNRANGQAIMEPMKDASGNVRKTPTGVTMLQPALITRQNLAQAQASYDKLKDEEIAQPPLPPRPPVLPQSSDTGPVREAAKTFWHNLTEGKNASGEGRFSNFKGPSANAPLPKSDPNKPYGGLRIGGYAGSHLYGDPLKIGGEKHGAQASD